MDAEKPQAEMSRCCLVKLGTILAPSPLFLTRFAPLRTPKKPCFSYENKAFWPLQSGCRGFESLFAH